MFIRANITCKYIHSHSHSHSCLQCFANSHCEQRNNNLIMQIRMKCCKARMYSQYRNKNTYTQTRHHKNIPSFHLETPSYSLFYCTIFACAFISCITLASVYTHGVRTKQLPHPISQPNPYTFFSHLMKSLNKRFNTVHHL